MPSRKVFLAILLMMSAPTVVLLCAPGVAMPDSSGAEMKLAQAWIRPWPPEKTHDSKRIQRASVFVVKEPYRGDAINLLQHQSVRLLSTDEQRHLMEGVELLGDQVVDRVIADAEAESKLPGTPPTDQSLAYARTLRGKLKPYLVRAVAANPGNFVFSVVWCGRGDLCVGNGALGKLNYVRKPLVIYLEEPPTEVWINANSTE